MQLLIDQAQLDAALQAVGRVVPRRPAAAGTTAVIVSAQEGWLELCATDLQSYARALLPAKVHAPGSACVEWQYFARVVSTLARDEVALSVSSSNRSLRLTCGPSAFRLRTTAADDFPLLEPPAAWEFSIAADDFADVISRTTFCAADSDESSPFFGVSISVSQGELEVAATDNFQLAHYVAGVEVRGGEEACPGFAAVLPTKGLNAFVKALAALGGERVEFTFSGRSLWLRSGGLSWSVRALETRYPDLTRYTGRLGGVRVALGKSALLDAVRQVASLPDEERTVAVRLEGSRLHLSSSHAEVGEAQTFVELGAQYPKRIVWLDSGRLQSALRAQPVEELWLYISEPLAPVAVLPADEKIRFRTFVTPVRYPVEESEAI